MASFQNAKVGNTNRIFAVKLQIKNQREAIGRRENNIFAACFN
tara:strand:- start:39002 stop:39130 length:129 start_codon:yes stop_codon:yes gene_type:complete